MTIENLKTEELFKNFINVTQKVSKERVEGLLRHILGDNNIIMIKKNNSNFYELYSLFEFHPNFSNKTKYGLEAFIINIATKGYIQLSFIDSRGNKDDISWVKISKVLAGVNLETLKRQTVYKALRVSITDQILKFKKDHYAINSCYISALSGEKVDSESVHVDHYKPTFYELANSWIDLIGLDNIKLKPLGFQLGSILVEEQRKNWSDYHKKYAKLRILSASENLARKRVQQYD